jgi:hypothetical protein
MAVPPRANISGKDFDCRADAFFSTISLARADRRKLRPAERLRSGFLWFAPIRERTGALLGGHCQ